MDAAIQSSVRRLLEAAALFKFDDDDAPQFAPAASPSELDELAVATNVDLPDDFIELLTLHRAIVAMNIHNGYWIGASVTGPLVLAQGPSTATCGAVPVPVLPVASDGGGNLFLRPLTMSSIWRWDHETGVTHQVADGLAEFLGIVAEDWEHAARGDEARVYLVSSNRYRRSPPTSGGPG
jgi:hypothetical protein